MPVIQNLVNPARDTRRSSHSKKHSSQKKSHSSTSRTPVYSDYSVDDTLPSISNAKLVSVKSESSLLSSQVSGKSGSPSDYLSIKSEPCTPRVKLEDFSNDMSDLPTNGVFQIPNDLCSRCMIL